MQQQQVYESFIKVEGLKFKRVSKLKQYVHFCNDDYASFDAHYIIYTYMYTNYLLVYIYLYINVCVYVYYFKFK